MTRLNVVCGCAVLLVSSAACAGTVSPEMWYEFGFDPGHAPSVAGCQPNDPSGVPCRPGVGIINLDMPPWTFASSQTAALLITDGLLAGDSFEVYDFGVLIGATPTGALSGHSCGLDPRVCSIDPEMSHAWLLLPSGTHSITISVHPAQILGEGFFELTAVPEPASVLLVTANLLWVWRRQRRST